MSKKINSHSFFFFGLFYEECNPLLFKDGPILVNQVFINKAPWFLRHLARNKRLSDFRGYSVFHPNIKSMSRAYWAFQFLPNSTYQGLHT